MAGDSTRDAKLSLKFETGDAMRSLKDVEQQAAKTRSAAESATATIGRYGSEELSRPESKANIRRAKGIDRIHDRAQADLDAYRLDKHYTGIRQSRAADEANSQSEFSSRIAGRMSGMGGMGMMGRLGVAGIAGAFTVGAINRGLDYASDTTTQRDDLTGAQKRNHVLDSITFGVAGSLLKFRNAMDGTTEGMRRAARNLVDMQTRAEIQGRNRSDMMAMQGGVDTARATAASLAGASAPMMPGFDRWSMAGQQAYEEYQTVTPAQDAAAAAEREARAARLAESSAAGRYGAAQRRYQMYRGATRRQGRNEAGYVSNENTYFDRNQLGRQNNLGALSANQTSEASTFEQMIQARKELERAGVSAAEAESRARQANLQVMQAELAVLTQREQRMTGDASRLGGMNVLDRRLGLEAARQVAANGIDNVAPEVRERARAFAPQWYQQRATQLGEGTAEYSAGRAEGFLTPGSQSIDSVRGEMANLQQQIREGAIENARRTAVEISNVMGRALEDIGPILEERIAQALRVLRTGRAIQNNQLN
jgi:hypothetical protein